MNRIDYETTLCYLQVNCWMNKIKIFIELTRLNKPIGFMLLFWPCLWGLTLALNQTKEFGLFIKYIILFFVGSVFMRSAGCIFNDITDKDFDKKVDRTKNRPIPSGRISTQESFVYIILLCLVAFIILIQFNFLTITINTLCLLLSIYEKVDLLASTFFRTYF